MPLPKLARLESDLTEAVQLRDRAVLKEQTDERIVVVPPNASEGEQIVWDYISKRDDHWRQQVTFGNIKEKGSTRTDFINDRLMIALYPQGEWVHRFKSAWDEVKYSLVRKHGYRVVVWLYRSNEHLKRNLSFWYNRDIG